MVIVSTKENTFLYVLFFVLYIHFRMLCSLSVLQGNLGQLFLCLFLIPVLSVSIDLIFELYEKFDLPLPAKWRQVKSHILLKFAFSFVLTIWSSSCIFQSHVSNWDGICAGRSKCFDACISLYPLVY